MKKTAVELLLGAALVALVLFVVYNVYPQKFVFYVSNQSPEKTPVGIKVYLDGVLIADKNFDYGTGREYERFDHSFSMGKHRLYAESISGGAQLNEEFIVLGKHWAVIEYKRVAGHATDGTPTPGSFSFRLTRKPVKF